MRGTGMAFRGFAAGEAPLVFSARRRRAAGALAALALVALALVPRPAAAATPVAGREQARTVPLRFATLAWDSDRAAVTRGLATAGFSPAPDEAEAGEAWRGHAYGRRALALPEFDAAGRLLALSLRFEAGRSEESLRRYGELVARVRRQFGPWAFQVAPGRPVREEHLGRYGITRTFGPRTAATLWVDAEGAAAAAQLDGDRVLWLRFESPRWEAGHAETGEGAPAR